MLPVASKEIVYYVTLLSNLALLFLVLARSARRRSDLLFSGVILSLALWIGTLYLYYTVSDPTAVVWLGRLNFAFASLIAPLMLEFVFHFPEVLGVIPKWVHVSIVSLTLLIFSLAALTPMVAQDELILGVGERKTIFGSLYSLYVLYFLFFVAVSIFILYKRYLAANGVKKLQLKYLIWGLFLSLVFGISTNIFIPLMTGNTDVQNLGPLATLILASFVTYSIIRHRLMDIRLAVRALLFRILVMAVLAGLLYLGAKLFTEDILESTRRNLALVALGGGGLLGLIYQPLDRFLRSITDKILFQREYNRNELMKNLSKLMAESIDLKEVEEGIRTTLQQVMRVDTVEFKLDLDNEKGRHPLLDYVRANTDLLIYDELSRIVAQLSDREKRKQAVLQAIQQEMREKEIALVVPLTATGGVIGILILGQKKGGDAFTSADLELLEQLSYQAGVAVENASLFEETKRFNLRLQREVKIATYDLEQRNKRLSVLRKLDHIILNTLNLNEMAQKIVELVSWEMGFAGAFLALLEKGTQGKSVLRATAISQTPSLNKVVQKLPNALQEYTLELDLDPSNLLCRAVKERRPFATDDFAELYVPPLDLRLARAVQKIARIEHSVVYPLSAKGKVLGVVVFGLPNSYQDLGPNDLELIEAFMDEVGIAIENAQLYERLQEVNENLRQANLRLKQMDKMKDELVSIASHELRTPMTSIKSYLWMALHKGDQDLSPRLHKYIQRALVSSDRMINLVNDMLSVSRLEGHRLELNLEAVDLVKLIGVVLADFKSKASAKGLWVKMADLVNDLPHVKADPERIREVLVNLVDNALKFTQQGGVIVSIKVRNTASPTSFRQAGDSRGRYLWVLVRDTGKGIAKEDMPRLFKKFGRLEQGDFSKMAERQGGTGLGLYISKGIVELHGGKIWAESRVGEGSTFAFSLPVV